MLFQNFPYTTFQTSKSEKVVVTDFIRAVRIDPSLKENDLFFSYYEARDGEMPEVISHKFYGTTQFHWVIMLINEKFDPYNDFPKDDASLIRYATDKYTDINGLHHYEDQFGNVVDQFTVGKIVINNIQYERAENEKKRSVKILNRDVLDAFVEQYESQIRI